MSHYFTSKTLFWTGDRYVVVGVVPIRYSGPIDMCKGDSTAQAAEQQQSTFDSQLMGLFTQQFGKQSAVNNYLQPKMQAIVDAGGQGYDPTTLTAMRTSVTDADSTAFQNAQKTLNAQTFANGSRMLPSGATDQLNKALLQSEAADKAADQNNITLQDANVKQANYWNAVNELNGVASSYNPQSYASAATSGSGAVSSLSQANTAAAGPGIGAILGGVAGSVGASMFGAAGKAGGFSSLFS